MTMTRRDAVHRAQPAQPRLRAWRDRRAPVPCALPSGIHLNFVLGLSKKVGPPQLGTRMDNPLPPSGTKILDKSGANDVSTGSPHLSWFVTETIPSFYSRVAVHPHNSP